MHKHTLTIKYSVQKLPFLSPPALKVMLTLLILYY